MIFNTASIVYAGYIVGPEVFAEYAIVMLIANIISLLKDLGYTPILITSKRRYQKRAKFSYIFINVLWSLLLVSLALGIYELLLEIDWINELGGIYVLILYVPLVFMGSSARVFGEKSGKHLLLMFIDLFGSALNLGLLVVALQYWQTPISLFIYAVSGAGFSAIMYIITIGRLVLPTRRHILAELRHLLSIKASLTDNLTFSFSIFLYRYVEPLIIAAYCTPTVYGSFSFSQRLVTQPSLSISTMINRYLGVWYAKAESLNTILRVYTTNVGFACFGSVLLSSLYFIILNTGLPTFVDSWEALPETLHALSIIACLQIANGNSGMIFNLQKKSRALREIGLIWVPLILFLNIFILINFGYTKFLEASVLITSLWSVVLARKVENMLNISGSLNPKLYLPIIVQATVYLLVIK